MYNFTGKYSAKEKQSPTEVDFHNFWKSMDDSIFLHLLSGAAEQKYNEIVSTPSCQMKDQNYGKFFFYIVGCKIIDRIRSGFNQFLERRCFNNFCINHDASSGESPINSPENQTIQRQPFSIELLGYNIVGVNGERELKGSLEDIIREQEKTLVEMRERESDANMQIIKKQEDIANCLE